MPTLPHVAFSVPIPPATACRSELVTVTMKKSSGEIWFETEPMSVLCTLGHIVFDMAGVDRLDSVVPYLLFGEKVQPYWKSLVHFREVRDGCEALVLTVVLQPKEIPIASLFAKAQPQNPDKTDMSYEAFETYLLDPVGDNYMDMEYLMNTLFPFKKVDNIWQWDRYPNRNPRKWTVWGGGDWTTCSNFHPVEAFEDPATGW